MKPLSERIRSFPTAQFVGWLCLACVDVREVRTEEDARDEINKIREALTERLNGLEARVKELEAELERLKAQEPAAWQFYDDGAWHNGSNHNNHRENTVKAGYRVRELYAEPRPAAAVPVKVPEEKNVETSYGKSDSYLDHAEGWNDCIAEVLRLNADAEAKE